MAGNRSKENSRVNHPANAMRRSKQSVWLPELIACWYKTQVAADAPAAPADRERATVADVTQTYPDFQSALAACGDGYNDADIADVIAFKSALPVDKREVSPEQAINSILSIAMAATDIRERPLTVLDFGGGCGFHYFRVRAALNVPLQWAVVETPTMASRAFKVAQGQFAVYSGIDEAAAALGRIDLVHASSAIQYVSDPLATLQALASLNARYFMLARFPLWHNPQVVGVQISTLAGNGIGPMPPNIPNRQIQYPVTFTNLADVVRVLDRYDLALATPSPSSQYNVRGQPVPGITLIFRAKERMAR
jgi:putative methyltransferase (TIGR04325 family)